MSTHGDKGIEKYVMQGLVGSYTSSVLHWGATMKMECEKED